MDSVQNFLQQAQGTVQNAIDQAPGAIQNALHQADGAFQKLAHDAPGIIQNAQTNVQKFANDAPGMIQNAINAATGASTQLQTRQLGKNGPYVTAVGFGTMGLSAFYGKPKPDAERFAVLDKAYEMGELFWDSADM
jgi:hypothetical protein